MKTAQKPPEAAAMWPKPTTYKSLRVGQAFSFLKDGAVYVRCRGGFRHGGGPHCR